jgi:RNA polymerase sigma-70 factor (ECF subfamily)
MSICHKSFTQYIVVKPTKIIRFCYNTSMSLIDQIIKGDSDAVLQFYKLYSPGLMKYLANKLPRREDAEEILNDIFFEALDTLSFFQKKSSVKTWLFTIAHNKIVDFYRKKKIRSILLSQVPFLEIVATEIDQPEFEYEKKKVSEKIDIAMKSLSEKYREILTLKYIKRFSIKQIALEMQLTIKAAESLLFRARQSFILAYERA